MDAENLLKELKYCFMENFSEWLVKSNHPKVYDFQPLIFEEIVNESLCEIMNVLMKDPDADYFWYGYPENGPGILTYSTPDHDVVPGDGLRVNKEKIKIFLRDIKINEILG